MLQGRLINYPDTHRHRLGPNYDQIPINCPYRARMGNYNTRDGFMTINGGNGSAPNYEPNSVSGTLFSLLSSLQPVNFFFSSAVRSDKKLVSNLAASFLPDARDFLLSSLTAVQPVIFSPA